MNEAGLEARLRSAVRSGDPEAVRDLLDQGADPNALDANGLPVLCVAVAAYDARVVEELAAGGADPDRVLPDGTTPLWRAVDGGSPEVFSAVLGPEPRLRLPHAERERLLTLARCRYETGAAEELRRRTSAPGPAEMVRVRDGEYDRVDQVSLGGDSSYEMRERDLLAAWAAEESDGEILARVLEAFTDRDHPAQEAIGLRHADLLPEIT
ncbi:ankyrin repeat domain-containing protein [Streptomyces sp. NPDC048201]|uniref:ankyrin repeat domain-containing protein n=1 Tax=Streptomyces sp. NPDC048201 TaxID=3365513 RepID=UPI0037211197